MKIPTNSVCYYSVKCENNDVSSIQYFEPEKYLRTLGLHSANPVYLIERGRFQIQVVNLSNKDITLKQNQWV
jgi:hypothetical protein